MSIFGTIMEKIFHAGSAIASEVSGAAMPGPAAEGVSAPSLATGAAPTAAAAAPAGLAQAGGSAVDVGAVLEQMAAQKGGGGNYQTSIVDLLKLLDLDSSLAARKTLAGELGVHEGADGSAEENIALHKAVMRKLAENGGKVPDSMKG